MARHGLLLAMSALILTGSVAPGDARAAVTAFQQGVSPTAEYAGCVDTFIVGHGWAHDRPINRPTGPALGPNTLMRFDVAGLGKDQVVNKAILRLYFASIPPQDLVLEVRTLTREWDATATWYEHTYKDAKKTDESNWAKFGGELDEADFGQGKPGLVAKAQVRGGPFGHIAELDVTRLVGEWVAGQRPNHGFHVVAQRGHFSITSSEWPMPAYRPALIVEHYGKGQAPAAEARIELPPEPGPKPKLSPLAAAGEVGAPAPWTLVRFGRNPNCQYRDGHLCGYAKTDPRYPGNWGWTPRLRVGGSAGDFNHALFYFDLSAVGKGAAIKRATLKAFVDLGNMRLPEDNLGQAPEKIDEREQQRILAYFRGRAGALSGYSFALSPINITGKHQGPGWKQEEFTFSQRQTGAAWGREAGTLLAATDSAPVAVCHVGEQWKDLRAAKEVSDTWLEWDLTGLVRAWVAGKAPNHGVVLDGRLMGGAITLFSDDWTEPDRRPYLEVEVSPGPTAKPDGPFKPEPLLPEGDYWVEPMRKAHARWKGIPGTFGQYGDSITITMAFWTPMSFGTYKGITPGMQEELDAARRWTYKPCWRQWKGGQWGNTGNMTIAWAFANVDAWQKKMNPEVAVILFGTNDVSQGLGCPDYTEMYAVVIDRMLADGTIPIVTTLPPHGAQKNSLGGLKGVLDRRQAAIAVAKQKKTPLIDFYTEIVKRQPKEWRTILIPDGLHPSYPNEFRRDWSDEGLKHSGYDLRNYLTLKAWYEIHQKVLKQQPVP